MRQHCIGGGIQYIQGRLIPGKLVCIDQPAACLVIGISGQVVIVIELAAHGWRKGAHQPFHLGLCGLRSSNCISSCQAGEILAEAMPSNEAMETSRSEEHTSELQSLRHLVCRL